MTLRVISDIVRQVARQDWEKPHTLSGTDTRRGTGDLPRIAERPRDEDRNAAAEEAAGLSLTV